MKYNSIGQQLVAKAKEIDPNFKDDQFNDMSEALDIILTNMVTTETIGEINTILDNINGEII